MQRLFLPSLKYAKSNIVKTTITCKQITKAFLTVFETAQDGAQKQLSWKRIPQASMAAMRQFNKTETTVCLWLSPLTGKVGKMLNTANVLQAPHTEQSCIRAGRTQGISIQKERETSKFSRLFGRTPIKPDLHWRNTEVCYWVREKRIFLLYKWELYLSFY